MESSLGWKIKVWNLNTAGPGLSWNRYFFQLVHNYSFKWFIKMPVANDAISAQWFLNTQSTWTVCFWPLDLWQCFTSSQMYKWLWRILWASNYANILIVNAGSCKTPQFEIGAACIQLSCIFLCEEVSFSLLARFYIRPGVLFAVNCNLPSKGKEFAPGAFHKMFTG